MTRLRVHVIIESAFIRASGIAFREEKYVQAFGAGGRGFESHRARSSMEFSIVLSLDNRYYEAGNNPC